MTTQTRPGEVEINGIKFPIEGEVKRSLVSLQVPRVTIGTPLSPDEPRASRITWRSARGGIGIEENADPTNIDRVWWSELSLRHNNLVLPPLITATEVASSGNDAECIGELGAAIYASFNAQIHKFSIDTNTGATSPTAAVNISSGGDAWANPTNVFSSNNAYAVTDLDGADDLSDILYADDFNFSLPTTTVVTGIELRVERKHSGANIKDELIQLTTDASSKFSDNKADTATNWTASDTTITYGSPTDLWGFSSLTPTEVNLATFGVRIKVRATAEVDASVDHVTLTIYYEAWGSSLQAIAGGDATDCLTVNLNGTDYLIFCNGANTYHSSDGSTWGNSTADIKYMAAFNDAVWGLQNDGKLMVTHNLTDWGEAGQLPLESGYASDLLVYSDAEGVAQLYAITKVGAYAWSEPASRFFKTQASFPYHPNGGEGSVIWRDALYMPAGLSVYKYIVGTPGTFASVGPADDDGLPTNNSGRITKLVGTQFDLLASVAGSGLLQTEVKAPTIGIGSTTNSGTTWSFTTAITIQDGAVAIGIGRFGSSGLHGFVIGRAFGHTLSSATDTPLGAKFTVWRGGLRPVGHDDEVFILSTATAQGSNQATTTDVWSTLAAQKTYGGSTGFLGTTSPLQSSEINSTDYGLKVSHRSTAPVGLFNWPSLDYYQSTVTYSRSTGSGYSSILAYDEIGWEVRVSGSATEQQIKDMYVSNAHSAYRLWFGRESTATLQHITLPTAIRNPRKDLDATYAASGEHITARFNGGDFRNNKLATSLIVSTLDLSETEKITPYYALDGAETWTALDAITTAGVKEFPFPNATTQNGLSFKDIRFRFVLERGADTKVSPALKGFELRYRHKFPASYGYDFVIDLTRLQGTSSWGNKGVRELYNDVLDAIESDQLITFEWRRGDDTSNDARPKYVDLTNYQAVEAPGSNYTGKVRVALQEL